MGFSVNGVLCACAALKQMKSQLGMGGPGRHAPAAAVALVCPPFWCISVLESVSLYA